MARAGLNKGVYTSLTKRLDCPAMKAVAYSDARTLPAPLREREDDGVAIEHDGRFTPGLRVKILLETGDERGVLLRWPR